MTDKYNGYPANASGSEEPDSAASHEQKNPVDEISFSV